MENFEPLVIGVSDLEHLDVRSFEGSEIASVFTKPAPVCEMSLFDAIQVAKEWVISAEGAMAIGMPVPSPASVVSALSYFAEEQWRPR